MGCKGWKGKLHEVVTENVQADVSMTTEPWM